MPDIDDPREARATFRKGDYARQTAGIAPRYVQGNVCIVPIGSALDFASFCQRNSKPCPLIGTGSPGDPTLPELGEIDIRTDLPRYSVFKDGKLVDEPTDIRKYWANDLERSYWAAQCHSSCRFAKPASGCSISSAGRWYRCIAPTGRACRPGPSKGAWWFQCGQCLRRMLFALSR
jgi:hypothetical protein